MSLEIFNQNWKKFVELYQVMAERNSDEDVLQVLTKQLFEVVWNGSVFEQYPIQMGSTSKRADLVLLDKNSRGFVCIELKKAAIVYDETQTKQLESYLKIANIRYGILISQSEIKLYRKSYVEEDKGESVEELSSFIISKENEKAVTFLSCLSRAYNDEQVLEDFCESEIKEKLKQTEKEKIIKDRLNLKSKIQKDLSNNWKNIFIEYIQTNTEFDIEKFGFEFLSEIIDDFSVEVNTLITTNPKINSLIKTERSKDTTRYEFKGMEYGKGKLVLAVVSDYLKNNKNISYVELKTIFFDNLQKGRCGVVRKANEVILKDPEKRYFFKYPLNVNGETVVVCSQWGIDNIGYFVDRAIDLGYNIKEIN